MTKLLYVGVQHDCVQPYWNVYSKITKRTKRVEGAIGSLSNDDGNGNENGTRKYIFISFVLRRVYFNSLNFYLFHGLIVLVYFC